MSFPFHNLKIESLPIHLNHDYYNDLFENDFLSMIPECFGILAVFIVLLYGVIWSNNENPVKNIDFVASGEDVQNADLRQFYKGKLQDASKEQDF